MQLARPAFAMNPKLFGRGRARIQSSPRDQLVPTKLSDDLKLFASTFLAGFVVVSILIA